MTTPQQMAKLQGILNQFEIHIAEANDLIALEEYEMVVIADDSGSMQRSALPRSMEKLGQPGPSRWDELKNTVGLVVDLGSCFDPSRLDVYFLNRGKVPGVKGSQDPRLQQQFALPPNGRTPLQATLKHAMQDMRKGMDLEKKILLFIMTDGVPDGGPEGFVAELRSLVRTGSGPKVKVQIMACTPEEEDVEYLDHLDRQLPEVDVTDDYYAEKAQVDKVGLAPQFNRADWCMKAMLGPISKKFDQWDEQMGKNKSDIPCGCLQC